MFDKLRAIIERRLGHICPDCGREDWNDTEHHGFNHRYDHCRWCGYCTYIQRFDPGKRGHNDD